MHVRLNLLGPITVGKATMAFVCAGVLLFVLPMLSTVQPFVVTSGSMEPTLPIGSIIYVVAREAYQVHDVITYRRGERLVTHRIVGEERVGHDVLYKTKGDANSVADIDLVRQEQIMGSSTLGIPHIGRVMLFYKSPIGFAAGIVLPTLVLLALLCMRQYPFGGVGERLYSSASILYNGTREA